MDGSTPIAVRDEDSPPISGDEWPSEEWSIPAEDWPDWTDDIVVTTKSPRTKGGRR